MPAPPKPENVRNPLRVLRGLLSERGKKRPITQAELSLRTGVPDTTIKAVEAGQRKLGESVRERVFWATGAQWDEKRWVCGFEWREDGGKWVWSERSLPFTYSVYSRFRKMQEMRPLNAVDEEVAIVGQLMELFMLIPDSQWWQLILRFRDVVEQRRKDYNVDKLRIDYKSTKALTAEGYLRVFRQRLMKAAYLLQML